ERKMKADAYPLYAAGVASLRSAPPRPDSAIAAFQQALENDDRSPAIYAVLADAYLIQYDSSHAPESLEAARSAARRADSPQPHFTLGVLYFRMGRPSEALPELQQATRFAPAHPDAFSSLGAVLILLERYGEAENALRKAIEIRPTRASFANLGVLLRYERKD